MTLTYLDHRDDALIRFQLPSGRGSAIHWKYPGSNVAACGRWLPTWAEVIPAHEADPVMCPRCRQHLHGDVSAHLRRRYG